MHDAIKRLKACWNIRRTLYDADTTQKHLVAASLELVNTRLELDYALNETFRIRSTYLDLIQNCLTGSIYKDPSCTAGEVQDYDSGTRESGWDWPQNAHTMIGRKRLENLRLLAESVIGNSVPGDFVETGVWRGGACILMRAVLHAYSVRDRNVWVADSFAGLPAPNGITYPADSKSKFHEYPELAVSLPEVQENFRAYGLLDEQVIFLEGWFKDTLPSAGIAQLALIRLDGDMYESTMDGLVNLYPKLSSGGYIIIDDYHVVPQCKEAVQDYWRENELAFDLFEIDGVGVYWKKA